MCEEVESYLEVVCRCRQGCVCAAVYNVSEVTLSVAITRIRLVC